MTDHNKDNEHFYNMVNADPGTAAKWQAVRDVVIEHARSIGADINEDDVARLPSARLAVLNGTPVQGNEYFERELNSLPQIAQARRDAAVREEVESGNEETRARLAAMPRHERLTFARKHNMMDASDQKRELSASEEEARLNDILSLPPAVRLTLARRHGLF